MACKIAVVSGMAFEAKIAQGADIETVYGLHSTTLSQAIEQAIANGAKGLLSFGTAAGLSSTLQAGAIIIGEEVHSEELYMTDATWAEKLKQQLPEAITGTIAGVDAPVVTKEEKSLLHKMSNAIAADMESHLIGRLAKKHNLPFAVLRVVLDDANTVLPPAAIAAVTPEGNISYRGLLAALVTNPLQLPALLKLGAADEKARKSLLRCGGLLKGSRFAFVDLG